MVKVKLGYKLSIYKWNEKEPDILLFYHMSEREMIEWIENLLSNPFNDVIHIEQETFKIAPYD